jgi:endonuclease I
MNSFIKKILITFLLVFTSITLIACDFPFFNSTTTAETTTITTVENITTGTWWVNDVAIELSGTYKNVYDLGESLDLSGLIVEAVNGLGQKTPITSAVYTVSGYNANSAGLQTVTITYGEFSKTFVVYVKESIAQADFTLEMTPPTKTAYIVGDSMDWTGFVLKLVAADDSFIVLNDTQYEVSPISFSQAATITVTISVLGLEASFQITITGTLALSTYYESATGLTGTTLKNQLRIIINTGFVGVDYGAARYMLDDTDRDPNNPNNVLLMYAGTSVSGVWDNGITWNREHVWPQSLLGVPADNGTVNAASDLQNLKPENPSINSSRGNKYFADATTTLSYAPRNEVRGDIARILFYMTIMYSNLTLVEQNPATYQMAVLSILLTWHDLDPVDAFERNRNEKIYEYQKNRNPFIDYPDFVDMIWS